MKLNLNRNSLRRCEELIRRAGQLRVAATTDGADAKLIDCGIRARGGLEAGRLVAEACLAGLGRVEFCRVRADLGPGPDVVVTTDQPVAACMASQYAGWRIEDADFFAMGSGPMRAARGKEALFDHIGHRERPDEVVGVLESGELPSAAACSRIAEECGVDLEGLTLLVAPTSSLAGGVQVVARSVETALHKMHELGFDVTRVCSGYGLAPLPPAAADDITAMGRTNDAVLYGGEAVLWVYGDDDSLRDVGPRIPSCSSSDHGQPFSVVFEASGRDFYKMDPLLFGPAVVTLVNVDTGRWHRYGQLRPDVVHRSFLQ